MGTKLPIYCVALILLSVATSTLAGVRVLSPLAASNQTFHAPEWVCTGPQRPIVTGKLLCLHHVVQNLSRTAEYLQQNYSGAILMVSTSQVLEGDYPPYHSKGEPERVLLDVIQRLNISGIFLFNTAARVGSTAEILLNDRSFCRLVGVPVFETGLNSAANLSKLCLTYAEQEDIIVELSAGDPNYWMTLKRGVFMIIWRIVATLAAAGAGIVAGAKLIGYVRLEGLRITIPQVTLGVQLIAALWRIGLTSTDPIYAGLAFNAVSAHMTTTLHFPLNFISLILLTMYWSEVLDASKIHITQFLTKLRIPFVVACVILYAAEIFATLVRAIRFGIRVNVASTISAVLYIIFMLTASVFFFIYGARVILRLYRSESLTNIKGAQNQNRKRDATLRRLTFMLVATGFFNLIFISAFVIAVFDSFFYTPIGFHLSWTLMYVGVLGGSICQVAAVKWPFEVAKSSTEIVSGRLHHSGATSASKSTGLTESNSVGLEQVDDEEQSDTGSE